MAELRIDVWSDIACPWCYIGKRRLEAAIARFPHGVRITWRAYELDPEAPRVRADGFTYAERLAAKYRTSVSRAEEMIRRMVEAGAEEGLSLRFDRVQQGNTFDAHRVLHLAGDRGVQDAVKERFLRAYLTEGEPIGLPETVARLAVEAGLDAAEVTDVLATDRFAQDVRNDEALAHELDIAGVPYFVIAGNLGVSGAQPADVLLQALQGGWSELVPGHAPVCRPEGCA